MYKPLPIGIDNFEKLVREGYYFVDKTLLIKELLDKKGETNLFTRPRRFGKTLNLSMLQYYFEDVRNTKGEKQDYSYLFDGLNIMQAGTEYLSYMGQYPVISLTLKAAKQPIFELATGMLKRQIANEYKRHIYVIANDGIFAKEREKYTRIMEEKGEETDYVDALQFLSQCLEKYHNRKVIILIDEYDVPLENAYMCGFYDEMVAFIRSLFESALKTNDSLNFAIITGCMRISKESIFTGLNNLNIVSILSQQYDEYFGFTDNEVKQICDFYGLTHKFELMKEWYNGYLFGAANVYNPWSVIKYLADLREDENALPRAYWANTSSNSIVRKLIDVADMDVKKELETLIEGGTIRKPIHEDITYDEIYNSMDNIWNFMLFTGYFCKVREWMEETTNQIWMELCIPNREVRYIFQNKVATWFDEYVKSYDRSRMIHALLHLEVEKFQMELVKALGDTISFYDKHENFYHGFLAGILTGIEGYEVKSNREHGEGRSDITIKPRYDFGAAYVLEFKVAKENKWLKIKAEEALRQIDEKGYAKEIEEDGFEKAYRYGIAFCGKRCFVKLKE